MPIARWDDSYKTGDAEVDGQHEHLFQMVNDLHQAIMAGKGDTQLAETLRGLARYTIEHFQTEERLMVSVGYPGLIEHTRKHEQLTREVRELVERFGKGRTSLTVSVSNFLADWLRHHIKEDDMELVRYMQLRAERELSARESV